MRQPQLHAQQTRTCNSSHEHDAIDTLTTEKGPRKWMKRYGGIASLLDEIVPGISFSDIIFPKIASEKRIVAAPSSSGNRGALCNLLLSLFISYLLENFCKENVV